MQINCENGLLLCLLLSSGIFFPDTKENNLANLMVSPDSGNTESVDDSEFAPMSDQIELASGFCDGSASTHNIFLQSDQGHRYWKFISMLTDTGNTGSTHKVKHRFAYYPRPGSPKMYTAFSAVFNIHKNFERVLFNMTKRTNYNNRLQLSIRINYCTFCAPWGKEPRKFRRYQHPS